ncbi:uncharacterized protein LOC131940623 [Physella acuta]|uniref:uncharacterized protein LOC131940623 n=1 Tax=Physella acuta TaxID=109671 RepID=UPI0027DB5A15|nr:uncharacterized protein LOC131940623 [Physella acuta]
MEERVSKLEKINWSSFVQRLDMLDLKTIPVLQNNVSFVLESLVAMEKTIDWVGEEQTTISGNACYVCGDNATQSYCNARTSKHIAPCNDDQPYCVTDVYQNGAFRRVYKRCATLAECQEAVSMNDPQCADDTFILPIILRCHFCCTKPACNDYIRPSSDLYEAPPTK